MGGKFSIVYSDEFLQYDFGEKHPLRQFRVKLAMELMCQTGVTAAEGVSLDGAHRAAPEALFLFHSPDYVDFVKHACEAGTGFLDGGDTPAVKGCFDAALWVVGTSVHAAKTVWQGESDHVYNLGGGLHHAHPGDASGFCVFNDIAVAIAHLLKTYGASKVAYIDIDAHHGDGVMYGFYADPRVLNIDFHEDGRYLFPGTGRVDELGEGEAQNFKVNVPLQPYSADASFGYAFRNLVPPLIRRFAPEIILMQTGVDSHLGDPLSHMNLSYRSYVEAIRIVHDLAHEVCDGKLVLFGGGGYNPAGVSILWTLMAATVAGVKIDDAMPSSWLATLTEMTEVSAPLALEEEPFEDRNYSQTLNTVYSLRGKLEL